MNTVMGVDVGGTKILIGIVRPDGTITHERRYPSQRGAQDAAIAAVKRAVAAYWAEMVETKVVPKPDAIGLGAGGAGGSPPRSLAFFHRHADSGTVSAGAGTYAAVPNPRNRGQ